MAKIDDIESGFDDLKRLYDGGAATILVTPDVFKVLNVLAENDEKRYGTLMRNIERDATGYPMTDQQKKSEGRHPDGDGRDVLIYAYKARQLRLYGFETKFRDKRCFIGTRVDTAKKRDGANQKTLKNAAKDSARYKNNGENDEKQAHARG